MIRSLHRRFLWNAYLLACIFLLIVMLGAFFLLARYTDSVIKGEVYDVLHHGADTPSDSVRRGVPSYLAEIRQKEPDLSARDLKEDDEVVFVRGDASIWTEELIRESTNAMLKSTDRFGFLRKESLCFAVDRTGGAIRIAAVDYTGFRSYLMRVALLGVLLYNVIGGVLFLLMKLAEIRLLRPAERAWTNQERFVEDASHEMKTPLAVILSNAELGRSEEPEETDRRFSMILSEAQRMKLLITRMLESARLENNAAKHLNDVVFSLSDAVTECALMYEEPFYEQGVTLCHEVDDGLYIRADETLLRQVLRALLENAGKYTPKGNRVCITVKRRYNTAVVTVRSEGVGLDKRERESIFERFYRADKARTHEEGSYGLGLSIAKNLAESIHGRIRCISDEQTYTAFELILPLKIKFAGT